MRRLLLAGVGLAALGGCGSQSAVGANSADSITTTAVGNIVGTIPSPTPTATADAAMTSNDATADNAADPVSGNAAEVFANDVH